MSPGDGTLTWRRQPWQLALMCWGTSHQPIPCNSTAPPIALMCAPGTPLKWLLDRLQSLLYPRTSFGFHFEVLSNLSAYMKLFGVRQLGISLRKECPWQTAEPYKVKFVSR